MLTDSSLTNILVVSGVSQIRYRVYSQHCNRENLANFLKCTPNYDTSNDVLMRTYTHLIASSIPVYWRISSEASTEPEKELKLELWVFWFDERHTGKIDANDDLYALDEIKVGSFTWESTYSKIQSPTASPVASTAQTNSPVSVSEEYRLFIKAVRNLVHTQMKNKGAFPLGEFYIFPNSYQQDVISDDKLNPAPDLLLLTSSMLCCSYNIYLASTNLIFQPHTRRMRIRPITLKTIQNRGKKVVISPSGDSAYIASNNAILPHYMEENILKKWSLLLEIPYTSLMQSTTHKKQPQQQAVIPNLVALKSSANEETFYFPTRLVFVSSSSKLSPTAMAGMNGLFAFNQGFTEDLGNKWQRWAWSEKISNYWEYVPPYDSIVNTVLDSLSQEGSSSSSGMLQKPSNDQPVMTSPLMNKKPVVTTLRNEANSMTPSSSIHDDMEDQQHLSFQQHTQQHRTNARYQSQLSLVDFAMVHFSMPNNPTEDLPEYPESMQNNVVNTPIATPATDNSLLQLPTETKPIIIKQEINTNTTNTANNSAYHSPQIPNLEIDSFGIVESMDVDSMVMDMPNRWDNDGMDDMDTFDFGVTEEDFDFFESGPTSAPPAPVPVTAQQPMLSVTAFSDNALILNELIKQEEPDTSFFENKEVMSLDQKQQQHMLDTEMENIHQHEISVTPLQVAMATQHHDPFTVPSAFQQEMMKQQQHQEMFVPPQFAPVSLEFAVNDAKYINGGKFTYTPAKNKWRRNGSDYQPDYIPVVRKKKSQGRRKSSKLLQDTIQSDNKALAILEIPNEEASGSVAVAASTVQSMSTLTEAVTSSSSEDSSTEEEEDDFLESENEFNEDEATKVSRTFQSLFRAQQKYVDHLMRLTPMLDKKQVSVNQLTMDYDSPFARTIASGVIQSQQVNENDDLKALDYLCQQVVMGGYPFAGGIESMSANGFEANEGESTKVVVARRRNLLQKFNGDTIHVPSTPNDVDMMTQQFKSVLSDVFYQNKSSDINDMCIDSLPLPASVTVKGPLSVQEYYDLSETNQAHSKYGKYQVKKRRPAEPNLDTLQPPHIMVSRQDEFLEGSPKMIMFWEKLRLEPYSIKKQVSYFVMYPKNEGIESSVSQFFRGLSTMYETCQLGSHHPANIGSYRKGLAPVPLLSQNGNESAEERRLRSYTAECQNLGTVIGSSMAENIHIVIYMINPSSHLSSNLDLSRCFSKLVSAYHSNARSGIKNRARIVLQLMPIEHLLRPTSFGGCLKFGFKEMVFSVYSKCHAVIGRHHMQQYSIAEMYAPPYVLAKPLQSSISFQLKQALSSFPTILENQAVLHMGYCFSFDQRWMILVWTDNCGELVEFAVLDNQKYTQLNHVFEEAWNRTKAIAKRTGFQWTFVIAKIGLLFEQELQSWISCVSTEENVAIVSLDMESALYVNPTYDTFTSVTSMSDPMPSTPMMNSTATSTKKVEVVEQTKALLLNHRVAYSTKRERAAFGILSMDPVSEVEEWMIPLASGYMIHSPPSTENPNNELFNTNPLVIEIHLLYNQTNHSAYSTLRDIIKKYHALSFVNVMPSNSNCLPIHLALVERLSRILLVVNT